MAKLQWIVEVSVAGQVLDKYLAAPGRLGPQSRAAKRARAGNVRERAETGVKEVRLQLKEGDQVRVLEDSPGSSKRRTVPFTAGSLRILYEDAFLIVLNKPAGLLAVPLERRAEEESILDQIQDHMRSHGKRKPLVVHRIDRDTSGVVLFAKDPRTHAALKRQFRAYTPDACIWLWLRTSGTLGRHLGDHLVWI